MAGYISYSEALRLRKEQEEKKKKGIADAFPGYAPKKYENAQVSTQNAKGDDYYSPLRQKLESNTLSIKNQAKRAEEKKAVEPVRAIPVSSEVSGRAQSYLNDPEWGAVAKKIIGKSSTELTTLKQTSTYNALPQALKTYIDDTIIASQSKQAAGSKTAGKVMSFTGGALDAATFGASENMNTGAAARFGEALKANYPKSNTVGEFAGTAVGGGISDIVARAGVTGIKSGIKALAKTAGKEITEQAADAASKQILKTAGKEAAVAGVSNAIYGVAFDASKGQDKSTIAKDALINLGIGSVLGGAIGGFTAKNALKKTFTLPEIKAVEEASDIIPGTPEREMPSANVDFYAPEQGAAMKQPIAGYLSSNPAYEDVLPGVDLLPKNTVFRNEVVDGTYSLKGRQAIYADEISKNAEQNGVTFTAAMENRINDLKQQLAEAVEDNYQYITNYKGKGAIWDTNINLDRPAEYMGGKYISQNDRWYQQFVRHYGRRPNKEEAKDLAYSLLFDPNNELYRPDMLEAITELDSMQSLATHIPQGKEILSIDMLDGGDVIANIGEPRMTIPSSKESLGGVLGPGVRVGGEASAVSAPNRRPIQQNPITQTAPPEVANATQKAPAAFVSQPTVNNANTATRGMTNNSVVGASLIGKKIVARDRNNVGTIMRYDPETDRYLLGFKSRDGSTAQKWFRSEELNIPETFKVVNQVAAQNPTPAVNASSVFGTEQRGMAKTSIPKSVEAGVEGMDQVQAGLSPESQVYTPESMDATLQKAWDSIKEDGSIEAAKDDLTTKMAGGRPLSDVEMTKAVEVIKQYSKQGDAESKRKAVDLTELLMTTATNMGRAINALKLLQKNTPEGFLMVAMKHVKEINKDLVGKAKVVLTDQDKIDLQILGDIATKEGRHGVEIGKASPELKVWLLKAETVKNLDWGNAAAGKAMAVIAEKQPSTGQQKFRALQRISMLSNPKTHIRNIAGNTAMLMGETAGTPAAAVWDKAMSKMTGQKTVAAVSPLNYLKGAKEGIDDALTDIKLGLDSNTKFNEEGHFQPQAFNPELAKNSFSKGTLTVLNALDQGISAVLKVPDAAAMMGQYKNALAQMMKANNVTEPTAEMIDAALQSGLRATFQDENAATALTQRIRNALDIDGKVMLGSAVAPFVKTPTNVIKIGLEYSPIGTVEAIAKTFFGKNSVKALASRGESTMSLQREAAELFGRGMVGSGLLLLGMGLKAAGYASGNDEEETKAHQAFNKAIGKYPNTIKIGDNYVDLSSLQLVATPLLAGAAVGNKKFDMGDYLLAVSKMGNTALEMPVIQGVQELLGGSYNKQSVVEGLFGLAADAATQVVPLGSLGRQISNFVDPYARDRSSNQEGVNKTAEEAKNKMMAMVPGLSDNFPVKYDTLGRPQKNYDADTTAGRAFNVFLNPVNSYEDNSNLLTDEIQGLYDETQDASVFPKVPRGDVSNAGVGYDLDAGERQGWQQEQGQTLSDTLQSLIRSDEYKQASPSEKVDLMNKAMDYSREKAKGSFLQNKGVSYDSSAVEKLDGAVAAGIKAGDYLAIKFRHDAIMDQYEDEKDQATAFSKYLDNMSLNQQQRDYIDNALGYWPVYKAKPEAYRLGLMSEKAQQKWNVAKKYDMSEEMYVKCYPLVWQDGKKKAGCLADLVDAGLSWEQANQFWDIIHSKKHQ